MPRTFHTDKDGFKHWGSEYDGLKLPLFEGVEEILSHLPSMPIRDDDILLLSYPKSGTHWIWEIINMVLNGNTEYMEMNKSQFFLEFSSHDNFVSNEARVLNTHLPLRMLPTEILDKKIKTVLIARNLKDVAVSLYCHLKMLDEETPYEGTFSSFLDIFLDGNLSYGSWFNYMLEWQNVFDNHPDWPVHIVLYEDLIEDPAREIQKLANFLGKYSDKDFCSQIADKCHIDRLKKAKPEPVRKTKAGCKFFRKGIVGDWKNFFNQEENEKFEELYKRQTKELKLNFRFEI